MKQIALILCLIAPLAALAQRDKAKPLSNENPLVGCWRFIDDGRVPEVLFPGDSSRFIWFGVNSASTVVARGYNQDKKQLTGTSSFVAYSDGKMIYGKVFKSDLDNTEGKEYSFRFTYNKGKDQVQIPGSGKPFTFERINPNTQEKIRKR